TSLIVSSSIILWRSRFGHANYAAGETTTSIASRLRFQIICFFVHDHSVTHDRISAGKFHHFIAPFQMSLAGSVGFNVAQIASVPIARVWRAVLLMRRIKMATGGTPIAGDRKSTRLNSSH